MMNQKQMLGLGLFTMLVVVLMGLTCESRASRYADRGDSARRPLMGAFGGAATGALVGGLAGGGRGAGIGAGVGAGVGLLSGIAANESARGYYDDRGEYYIDEGYYNPELDETGYYADTTGTVQKKDNKYVKRVKEKSTRAKRSRTHKTKAASKATKPLNVVY